MLGIIMITDLAIECFVGVYEHEKNQRQLLYFDITLKSDFTAAIASDDVKDCLDYDKVVFLCQKIAQREHYHLLERLGAILLEELFQQFPLLGVRVQIKKPKALKTASSAAIILEKGDLL